ncbi:hypothetical protein HOD08_03885 [bacterium]|nr:hypothetical protein [bacterium]
MKHFAKLALALGIGFAWHNSNARVKAFTPPGRNTYTALTIFADSTEEQLCQEFGKIPDDRDVRIDFCLSEGKFHNFVKRHHHLAARIGAINTGSYTIGTSTLTTYCKHCKNLHFLYIDINCETIPKEVGELTNLKDLSVRGNIKYLPDSLKTKVCTPGSNFNLFVGYHGAGFFDIQEQDPIAMINFKNGTDRFLCNGGIGGITRNHKKTVEINLRMALFHTPDTLQKELLIKLVVHGLNTLGNYEGLPKSLCDKLNRLREINAGMEKVVNILNSDCTVIKAGKIYPTIENPGPFQH